LKLALLTLTKISCQDDFDLMPGADRTNKKGQLSDIQANPGLI
jgi:hypothetical protein